MYKCVHHAVNIMSNTLFCSTGDKEDELNNLIAELNGDNIVETATQSPMVTQRPDVGPQSKIFVSLTLP